MARTGVTESIPQPRIAYLRGSLEESDVADGPVATLRRWLADAEGEKVHEPYAMTLATVGKDGAPTTRIVLLREFDESGLVFFTNYESKKGLDLSHEPRVAASFFWPELERQVRVIGRASKVSRETTVAYFATRPRESQLGAWASPQSRGLIARGELESRLAEFERKFAGQEVPAPGHWGGYRIVPVGFEFWQGRQSRLHDRLTFNREPDGPWRLTRLAP